MITSPNPVSAFHTASMFQQIDLGVTLRSAADTFKEEVAGMLIGWLADMCQSTIGGDEDTFKRLVAQSLLEPRPIKNGGGTPVPSDLRALHERSMMRKDVMRIDWLFQLDARLWKKAKWDLRSIYSGLYCLDWDVKKEMGKSIPVNVREIAEDDQLSTSHSTTSGCSSTTSSTTETSRPISFSASLTWSSVAEKHASMPPPRLSFSTRCSTSRTLGTPIR